MKAGMLLPMVFFATAALCAAPDGAALTEEKCAACHLVSNITPEKIKNMSAPPIWGVMKKINQKYPTREERVAFLIDYTLHPAKEKMLFPPSTAELFGVMPSQQGNLTDEELKAIAAHLYPKN